MTKTLKQFVRRQVDAGKDDITIWRLAEKEFFHAPWNYVRAIIRSYKKELSK